MSDDPQLKLKSATIVDVAEAAGVAIGTVSRYLNGETVRRSNRDAIEEAIGKLGYRRNAVAAAMKTDNTNIVGMMTSSLSEYHSGILEHLVRGMRGVGRAVLTYQHDTIPKAVEDGLDFFDTQRVDSVIMDATHGPGAEGAVERIRSLIRHGTPVVFYDNDVPSLPVDRVFVENRAASQRIVRHLLDLGHSRIAVLAGAQYSFTGRERLQGYLDAMREAGIEPRAEYIMDCHWTEIEGYKATRQLMALPERPTALFSCNYNMTVGALSLLKECKLKVPSDLSLVSFDDIPLFRLMDPGITCVAQPIAKIAESILGLMLDRLTPAGRNAPNTTITLDCEIMLRGSARRVDR